MGVDISSLSVAVVSTLSPTQASGLSNAQVSALGVKVGAFSASVMSSLTETQLSSIRPEVIALLSGIQLMAFNSKRIESGLDLLRPAATQSGDLPRVNEDDRAAPILDLAPHVEGFIGLLSMDAIARMTAEQVDDLLFALSSAVPGPLSVLQFSTLSDRLVDSLSPDQISSLGVNIAALSVSATARLSAAQLNALTPGAIAGLTDLQLAALSETQLLALSAASR